MHLEFCASGCITVPSTSTYRPTSTFKVLVVLIAMLLALDSRASLVLCSWGNTCLLTKSGVSNIITILRILKRTKSRAPGSCRDEVGARRLARCERANDELLAEFGEDTALVHAVENARSVLSGVAQRRGPARVTLEKLGHVVDRVVHHHPQIFNVTIHPLPRLFKAAEEFAQQPLTFYAFI